MPAHASSPADHSAASASRTSATEATAASAALDEALAAVENLSDAPLPAHVEAFERAHQLLQERLGEADG